MAPEHCSWCLYLRACHASQCERLSPSNQDSRCQSQPVPLAWSQLGSYYGYRAAVSTEDDALGPLNCVSVIWDQNLIVPHWHEGIDSDFQLVSPSWITWNCRFMLYTRTYSTLLKIPTPQWMKSYSLKYSALIMTLMINRKLGIRFSACVNWLI